MNKIPLKKKKIANNAKALDWRCGESNTNVILENSGLDVKLLRYIISSADGKTSYDTFSIRESKNNTVTVIRNQRNEIGLVYEWRPIPEKWFWACVRGFADPKDKNNIEAGKRELIEEIGHCQIKDNKNLGVLYQNTTFFENAVGLVLLDVEVIDHKMSQEEGIVDFQFFTKEEIMTKIRADEVEDTFTLSALMRYFALEGLY